jgi:hypothetical protein
MMIFKYLDSTAAACLRLSYRRFYPMFKELFEHPSLRPPCGAISWHRKANHMKSHKKCRVRYELYNVPVPLWLLLSGWVEKARPPLYFNDDVYKFVTKKRWKELF